MLHLGQVLGSLHYLPQALIIKLVGRSSRRLATKSGAHRDRVVRLRDVLMNGVIGKARQRKAPARKKNLYFVRGRDLPDAIKNVASLFFREHSALGIQHSAVGIQPARRSASTLRRSDANIRFTSTTLIFKRPYSGSATNLKSWANRKWYSSSLADPAAIPRNLWNSPLPRLPQPSAMFAAIETAALRI